MAAHTPETILSVEHWNDSLFSFRTTRSSSLRFDSGHFLMVGLPNGERPLLRAYSIVSATYDPYLEFLSIKVPNGPLTSRLQHIKVGDEILVSQKAVGTLVVDDLLPGKNIYLLATGTGLAPFLSIIKQPEIYDRFEKVVLVHGVRHVSDLAYENTIRAELHEHPLVGEQVQEQLIYVPTVTQEDFHTQGRITSLIENGKLSSLSGLPKLNPDTDRVMLCGSVGMLQDLTELLESKGFKPSEQRGVAGHFVIEKAFAEQ
ncbi:ferredoxin--NADP reductase [Pusillimonas sp. MFBS29]|uniref:ferredoxin--NADP reductase n=1 Tax=Pusillimonas sp. MFBS29 TaxID=2886690 RepID=UPI001D124F94|nr:ferredoxin--NADP reductase [Pusillimonas sp. MFBS29]MCC2595888.1 ferredoxin--NADP reductase [Pusillimonas sp. MFBS29]